MPTRQDVSVARDKFSVAVAGARWRTGAPQGVSSEQAATRNNSRNTASLASHTKRRGGSWAVLQRLPFGKLLNKPGTMFTDRLQCKRWHRLTYTRSRGQRLHGLGRIQWLWKNFGICQHEDLKSTLTPTHPHACMRSVRCRKDIQENFPKRKFQEFILY